MDLLKTVSKIKNVDQLWKVLGILDPMGKDQVLILEELERTKPKLVAEYTKLWNETFND